MTVDPQAWTAQYEVVDAVLDPLPAMALAGALGRDDRPNHGDPLPPFWHHLYAQKVVSVDATGLDGHERLGRFLPPVDLPRRMWACGRIAFLRPLPIGERIRRVSIVRRVERKAGRSGPLAIVTVEHRINLGQEPAVIEEQDLVYLDARGALRTERATPGSWYRTWLPDPVLLFRYSALTYNGHRIHYDRTYAAEVEGYPERVVHGPLLATLMLDLVRREAPAATVRSFWFRAVAPLFVGVPLTVHGTPKGGVIDLQVAGDDGRLAMHGAAELDTGSRPSAHAGWASAMARTQGSPDA